MRREIFVFGSNLAGIHGAGSARHALDHCGAVLGQGIGLQGNSYAIPTKDNNLCVMALDEIAAHVSNFLKFASDRPDMTFKIVAIGCGLAGYKPEQIAPMFIGASDNCILPQEFVETIHA